MKFKNGRTPFWNDVTAVWRVFTIMRMWKKTSKNIEKSCQKSWKMTSPGLPKSIKKLVQKNVAKKNPKQLDFLLKWWKIEPQWIPKGVPGGSLFGVFLMFFRPWGPGGSQTPSPGCPREPQGPFFHDFLRFWDRFFWCFRDKKTRSTTLAKQAF